MGETVVYYGEMTSPVGPLTILVSDNKAIRIDFGLMNDKKTQIVRWLKRYFANPLLIEQKEKVDHIIQQIDEYFAKTRQTFDFPYTFYGTSFQKQVWQALLDTTYGQVKTYKDIAKAIHHEKAVRAVGGAIGKNPLVIVVPCHRIIGSNGELTGFGGGLANKEILLKLEGCL